MLRSSAVFLVIGLVSSINLNAPLKSRLLRNVRGLEEDESVYSWMIDYSLKFTSCHTVTDYGIDNDGAGYVYKQNLVKFKICPTETCDSTCKGDNYLVPLEDYAKAYAEQKKIDKAYACAQVKRDCVCEENEEGEEGEEEGEEEEECEVTCYRSAGLDYCIEQESGDSNDESEEPNMENYIQCQELDMNDDGYGQFYIGLKCAEDGLGVNVGIFTDNICSVEKNDEVYLPATEYLPYQNETIISNDCMNCTQLEGYDDSNDKEEEEGEEEEENVEEVSEMCLVTYIESAKCEENPEIYYPNTDGCELMSQLYLREDGYEPENTSSLRFSLHFLMAISVIFAFVTFRLCYIAQKQQRKIREDGMKWRNRLV